MRAVAVDAKQVLCYRQVATYSYNYKQPQNNENFSLKASLKNHQSISILIPPSRVLQKAAQSLQATKPSIEGMK